MPFRAVQTQRLTPCLETAWDGMASTAELHRGIASKEGLPRLPMHRFTVNRICSRTAFTLLLVRLVSLGSGGGVACLRQERGTHSHVSPTDPLPVAQALNVSPGQFGMDDDHPGHVGGARGICLKLCGDGTQSTVEQAPGFDVPHVVVAPRSAVGLNFPRPTRLCTQVQHGDPATKLCGRGRHRARGYPPEDLMPCP